MAKQYRQHTPTTFSKKRELETFVEEIMKEEVMPTRRILRLCMLVAITEGFVLSFIFLSVLLVRLAYAV